MASYQYSSEPRNPLRFVVGVARLLRDPERTDEAAVVEHTFNRSRWGRKLARWDEVARRAADADPSLAAIMAGRPRLPWIDMDVLRGLPEGSLGRTLATKEDARGMNPNLTDPLPDGSEGEWLVAHLFETHDIWHVVTGNPFDLRGEFGVAGVYMGQLSSPPFFAFMFALLLLHAVWRDPTSVGGKIAAFVGGYVAGRRAARLTGMDWSTLWRRNLDELREELGFETSLSETATETDNRLHARMGV